MNRKYSVLFFLFLWSLSLNAQRNLSQAENQDYELDIPKKENLWVFIMAGQSNMAGRGTVEPQDTIVNERILTINKYDDWVYAKEPLHFYEPSLTGLDSGLSFARELLKYAPKNVSIAVLPAAVGGSSIEQWQNDESHRGVKLLSNLRSKIVLAQEAGTLKAVLWHQGESNANEKSLPSYTAKLQDLMHEVRAMANNDSLPLLLGELGHYAIPEAKQKRWNALNEIIKNYTEQDPHSYLILTDSLTHKGDYLHFDSNSQREFGRRLAKKYAKNYLQLNNH